MQDHLYEYPGGAAICEESFFPVCFVLQTFGWRAFFVQLAL